MSQYDFYLCLGLGCRKNVYLYFNIYLRGYLVLIYDCLELEIFRG